MSSTAAWPEGNQAIEFPMSFAQQRLWFIDRMNPGSPAYNLPVNRLLRGPLDVATLEQSVRRVIMRHEMLRTTFAVSGNQPVQVISPGTEFHLPVIDYSSLPPADRDDRAGKLATAEASTPFDLSKGPLLRALLLKLDEEEHLLLLTLHHIVADGWSIGVLMQEIAAFYNAGIKGISPPIPDLTVQYADYAVWQRESLQGEALERHLSYWKGQLAGLAPLELTIDRRRPPIQTFNGGSHAFRIPGQVARRLHHLAREEGATPFIVLLAAFKGILHRYSGQTDLTVGVPTAGRSQREIEALIGFFVNTVVIRTNLEGEPSFREMVRRVRSVVLDAFSHDEIPFERLVEELRPARDTSRSPLFQVMFELQTANRSKQLFEGIESRPFRAGKGTSKFDLTLVMSDRRGEISGRFVYNSDLFDASTIARMANHFRVLLRAVSAKPDAPLGRLPMLGGEEREQLLSGCNQTESAYPSGKSVHEVFANEVVRSPESEALVHAPLGSSTREVTTYAALDRRANQLAHYLMRLGVLKGDVVALCMERSVDFIVGALAVLKSGAAYLPLDPTNPGERLRTTLEDASVRALITRGSLREGLPARASFAVIDMDAARNDLAKYPSTSPEVSVGSNDPACIIYTSGSTGAPKGVVVPHRGIVRLVVDTDYDRFGPEDVVAHVSNPSFDAATFEIWGALLNGSRLAIIDRDDVLSPAAFSEAVREHGVTMLLVTTALFNILAREAPGIFTGIRTVFFGGEASDPRSARAVLENGPPERLVHLYGPTETTTVATWHLVEHVPEDATTIPIGRPIANTTAYVLDAYRNPVPVGIAGELYVGGDGVALGYLNRPELTAERFVKDPFSKNGSARLYRTGDIVRRRTDGALEFIGRADRQVKIRGFRVELGEIESVLRQHPAVAECTAEIWETAAGQKQIAAYVVQDDSASIEALRDYLKSNLPAHAVPSSLIRLDRLPLTPIGKIDRSALPVPERPEPSRTVFESPRNAIEARLTRVWEHVLGHEPIGRQDDFFELGGHSLLAVQLIAAVERTFRRKLPLSVLFSAPTVALLARMLADESSETDWQALTPIQTKGELSPLFCVHGVAGHVFKYARLARHLGPQQPLYALQSPGFDGGSIPFRNVHEMARDYIEEIQTVRPSGPYLLASNCAGGLLALEMARQLEESGHDVPLIVLFDPPVPGIGNLLRKNLKDLTRKRIRRYLTARMLSAAGFRLPRPLRQAYVATFNKRLFSGYRPQTVKAGIAIIRTTGSGSSPLDRGWSRLTCGDTTVYQIDGPHDLLQEPYVETLASYLQDAIRLAFAGSAGLNENMEERSAPSSRLALTI